AAEFEIFTGNILADTDLQEKLTAEKAELVVANILAEIIEPLVGIVDRFMADNGIFISSGILDTKEQLIVDAVSKNPNLELVETEHDGDWVRVVAKKVVK
ncbi:MAG: 50S ribosomal protein L11 methyltransferase, partial [Parasporobacterium sp.]|nr:50S ribosomal protein L11 methyltransferase [Parasporobacterium sp.]